MREANDRFGLGQGDQLLRVAAAHIKANAPGALLCRWEGSVFGVLQGVEALEAFQWTLGVAETFQPPEEMSAHPEAAGIQGVVVSLWNKTTLEELASFLALTKRLRAAQDMPLVMLI